MGRAFFSFFVGKGGDPILIFLKGELKRGEQFSKGGNQPRMKLWKFNTLFARNINVLVHKFQFQHLTDLFLSVQVQIVWVDQLFSCFQQFITTLFHCIALTNNYVIKTVLQLCLLTSKTEFLCKKMSRQVFRYMYPKTK